MQKANEYEVKITKKIQYDISKKKYLTTLDPENAALAKSENNEALAPIFWKQWLSYQPEPLGGDCIHGTYGPASWIMRIPQHWNGKLVSCATPSTRNAFSLDLIWSDYLLARGYAFLCSDKGTPGFNVDSDIFSKIKNALIQPGAMNLWHQTYREITRWAKGYLTTQKINEKNSVVTYAVGVSNGGYVVRYALENDSKENPLFDGGLDWEGVCWSRKKLDLVSTMQIAISESANLFSNSTLSKQQAKAKLIDSGMPRNAPDSLLKYYEQWYWFTVLNIYRDYLHPEAEPRLEWKDYVQLQQDGTRDTQNDILFTKYQWNPMVPPIAPRYDEIENTGEINVPLISLVGSLDCLIYPEIHGVGYKELVQSQGCSENHRLYWVENGTHIDSLVNSVFDQEQRLKPILPHAYQCFEYLESWVETSTRPSLTHYF
ncbi:MAG: alpha/beta hydrolase [Pseudomonadota bacterium]